MQTPAANGLRHSMLSNRSFTYFFGVVLVNLFSEDSHRVLTVTENANGKTLIAHWLHARRPSLLQKAVANVIN